MIEINLLPDELKVKAKGRFPDPAITKIQIALIRDRAFIYAIPALLAVFILMHFYFSVLWVSKNGQLTVLNRKLLAMAEQKKELDAFNREFAPVFQNASVPVHLSRQRILWAQKLNALSLHLPAGVWFNHISLNGNNLTIQGSVISLQNEEVSLINKFLDNLKTALEFSKDFSSFELNKVQKRNLGGYDIADFVLVGALKSK